MTTAGDVVAHAAGAVTGTVEHATGTASDALELAEGVWGLIFDHRRGDPAPTPPSPAAQRAPASEPAVVTPVRDDPAAHADAVMDGHIAEEVIEPEPRPAPVDLTGSRPVSTEPELVGTVAEEGAEDGAGAQIRIAEPWESYRLMTAADIADRLASATTAEVAAVELFELSGRRRKTVLAAAHRRLRAA